MRWRPDGWEAELRIGLLTPHADIGPECELGAMAPAGVGIHSARSPFDAMAAGGGMDPTIPLAPVAAFAERPELDTAAELLAAAPIDAIAFGFTSSAYVLGRDGEREMVARLEGRTRGIPVVAACEAGLEALQALGAGRLALVAPPWFDSELVALGRRYYEAAGHEVVFSAACGLPSDQSEITPDGLHAWVIEQAPAEADAVVIGGNGFRAVGVIAALEEDLERPVVTANQALFWSALRAAGADASAVSGYGRLFAVT
jgi:maleate isomerase